MQCQSHKTLLHEKLIKCNSIVQIHVKRYIQYTIFQHRIQWIPFTFADSSSLAQVPTHTHTPHLYLGDDVAANSNVVNGNDGAFTWTVILGHRGRKKIPIKQTIQSNRIHYSTRCVRYIYISFRWCSQSEMHLCQIYVKVVVWTIVIVSDQTSFVAL